MTMKNFLPLVSVRVVCYNQVDFIEDCLKSILNQDYENIEIVVSDDASQDGTVGILKNYEQEFPSIIKLALSEQNEGITKNINSGLKLCEGKYICGIGGDDLMLPGKIRKQVEYMEKNPECTICYHNLDVFQSETNETLYYFNEKYKYEGDVYTAIKYGTFNGACSTMVRKDKTPKDGFNELIPVASDWLYWVETLHNGGRINYIDEILGRYRRHENNITNKSKSISQNEIDHLNSCHIILRLDKKYFKAVYFRYSIILRSLRHKLNYTEALLQSLKLNFNLKAFVALVLYLISFKRVKV